MPAQEPPELDPLPHGPPPPRMEHRLATGVLGVLVLALLGLGVYLGWRRTQPRPRRSHARPASPRGQAPPRAPVHTTSAGPRPSNDRPQAARRPPSAADRMEALRLRAEARRDRDANRPLPCLKKLDRAERLVPDPEGQWSYLRAICEILAGHCEQGEARLLALLGRAHPTRQPERLRQQAQALADRWCPVDQGPAADRVRRLARLVPRLRRLGHLKACRQRAKTLVALWPTVPPARRRALRTQVHNALVEAARCSGWLGHCAEAWQLWQRAYHRKFDHSLPPVHVEKMARAAFSAGVRGCDPPRSSNTPRPPVDRPAIRP